MNPTRKNHQYSSSSSSSKPKSTITNTTTTRSTSDHSIINSSSSIRKSNFLKWVPNHKTPSSNSSKTSSDPVPSRVNSTSSVKSLTLSADHTFCSNNRSSLLNKKKNTHFLKQQEIKNQALVTEMDRKNKEIIKEKKMIVKPKTKVEEGGGGGIEVEVEDKRKSVGLVDGGGGGRRKSFCDSMIELSDFFSTVGARIMAVDMPPFMQIHAVSCARETYDGLGDNFTSKNLALTLKKEFDGVYGPAWHCIVGTSFGSFVTHSVGGFLYFSMDHKLHILLFKTTVQKAD